MLILNSRNIQIEGQPLRGRKVARLRAPVDGAKLTPDDIVLGSPDYRVSPGQTIFTLRRDAVHQRLPPGATQVTLPDEFDYLRDGDVVAISFERPSIRVLYRRNSPNNSFLLTERCNHYCLMCSQPPKDVNDDWLVDEILAAIPLVNSDTAEIGFTGGEPTLLGERFLGLIQVMREHLPTTALHILSNGRRFADYAFAHRYADVGHPDAMLGIPIYAAVPHLHDYVVQADGAFDETIRGILNLKALRQRVEVRVVIHRQNVLHLEGLAEFITRNLTFVDHVALMGLEMTGFAKANVEVLWVDPADYRNELYRAATVLDDSGMRVSIYNHQLCTIDRRLEPLAVRSISDWKNEYLPECVRCDARDRCGGFFATGSLRRSQRIKAILAHEA